MICRVDTVMQTGCRALMRCLRRYWVEIAADRPGPGTGQYPFDLFLWVESAHKPLRRLRAASLFPAISQQTPIKSVIARRRWDNRHCRSRGRWCGSVVEQWPIAKCVGDAWTAF
jgi:hypothetical protein